MFDKNGVEIITGDVVRITGAYFQNDNGLWFVDNSPGDPTWCGSDYSLGRLLKNGKLSTAKHRICFWPISVFVNDRREAARAREWNVTHAEIEVLKFEPLCYLEEYFRDLADGVEARVERARWDFGDDEAARLETQAAHYREVADRLKR